MINGIIPLYKPLGLTSFGCVSKIRGIVHQKKVGHSGTLDPNVDGVLPICLGNGTKVVDYLMATGKTYRGAITLGFATTTEDLDGEIVAEQHDFKPLTDAQIKTGLTHFIGSHIQTPPMYSAVKVNGRRLYDYARHGETVKRPQRTIRVTDFYQIGESIVDWNAGTQTIFFEVDCGKGTYVRTLAVDFGRYFGLPAVMSQLTRIASGGFDIQQTVALETLEDAQQAGQLDQFVYPIDHALHAFAHVDLTAEQWMQVQHGAFLPASDLQTTEAEIVLRYNSSDKALYYYDESHQRYKPQKMFSLE
ncbi:tRNA pseudouridine(55) synthase TruB [Fructilactobacillus cliffordii]|uniref:tRNA pseudouridine synthase B n=1 Tax=Fructilactobacillus cliffordii TaxID=2940299 RepID=A0A9Q8ZUM7_9LACO|nr:tRNA pseudouridine(55) synthase TruB [Fructilactobacillus cliffordii]USS89567.1 tRNA pseudouridine(55) synthase TruB [Fructilactobacillus cliffordii]